MEEVIEEEGQLDTDHDGEISEEEYLDWKRGFTG